MEELNSLTKRVHKISVTGRRTCSVTGVADVISFDVNEVILDTDQGMLLVKGKELHVSRLSLDKGEIDFTGSIDSFVYSDAKQSKGKNESLVSRLFR